MGRISKKRLMGSLALRIFLLSLLLLIIPLIIHTLFLYENEYEKSKKELFSTLHLIGESRLLSLEQLVKNQENFLSLVAENISVNSDGGLNAFFSIWAELFQVSQLFYVQEEAGKFFCVASSEEGMVGEDFSFLRAGLSKGTFLFLSENSRFSERLLYIAKPLVDPHVKEPVGALVAALPASRLLQKFPINQVSPYPIDLSFMDKKGWVLASSDPEMAAKKLVFGKEAKGGVAVVPVEKIPDGWEILAKERDFAVILPVEKGSFSLLLDVSEKRVSAIQKEHFAWRVLLFLFLALVVGVGVVLLLTFRLSKPLQSLCRMIDRIGSGDLGARFRRDAWGFEINMVGEHLNATMDDLVSHQEKAEVQRMHRERLEGELQIGRQIQKSMFPLSLPEIPELDIAAGYVPAKEVGGDFYDLFLSKERLVIAIADTAGKGISACLYSLGVRSILRSYASLSYPLEEILRLANDLFCRDVGESGFFATVWLGIFDPQTKQLQFSSAGHFPALLRKKNGTIHQLATDGIALGVMPAERIEVKTVQLEPQDELLLYTDGIVEARDENGRLFGLARLETLLRSQENVPARYLVKEVLQEVKNFAGASEQEDDQTLLAIRIIQ